MSADLDMSDALDSATTVITETPTMKPTSSYTELQIDVLTEGSGPHPQPGDQVKVHYTGTLASDGSEFDSSRKRNRLFEFELGQGRVIKGWDEGVAKMKKGERSILRVPAEMGYGASGAGANIPPNADLNFDVELVSFGPKPKEKWY